MSAAAPCALPEAALLQKYRRAGAYTDCYSTDVAQPVSIAQFVAAFYTTRVFKLERMFLSWALSMPSTDEEARQLAAGETDKFAAWNVEARAQSELLLCPVDRRTRSWLMVEPEGAGTRLYFGSAVVPRASGAPLGATFRALLGFHRLYSRVLLNAARARLR